MRLPLEQSQEDKARPQGCNSIQQGPCSVPNNNNPGAIARTSKPHSLRKGTELASYNFPEQLNFPSDSSPVLGTEHPI